METLAKMFFAFLNKDPTMRAGIIQSIDFIVGLDTRMRERDEIANDRMRAIEAALSIKTGREFHAPPLNAETLPDIGRKSNGATHQ